MGTSKGLPTPSGGAWTPVKNDVTDFLGGDSNISAEQIVAGTLTAAQGLLGGIGPATPLSGAPGTGGGGVGSGGGRRGAGGAGSGARGGGARAGRAAVGKALSGLAGFGTAVQRAGLDEGLRSLGLEDLRGRPAAEVIAAIADHLSEDIDGLASEVLKNALRDSILEAAQLAGDPTYENLEAALQGFLASDGIEGLVELFLANVAFDQVWSLIENHAELKSDDATQSQTLAEAIQHCCRSEARQLMTELKKDGRIGSTDWFGRDGQRYARDIAEQLEKQLMGLGD